MFANAGFSRNISIGSALVFLVLLIGAAVFHHNRVVAALNNQARETLEGQWSAMKGYLRVGKNGQTWYYDNRDPDEVATVARIQRYYLLADSKGRVLQVSDAYENIGRDSSYQIMSRLREALDSPGAGKALWFRRDAFLIRAGIVFDQDRRSPYYVAIATPLDENDWIFRAVNWSLIGVIACAVILGWFLGRVVPQIRPA
jgi:hypothetical protein